LKLRDYQDRCVKAVLSEFENGTKSTLVVLPTGAGKTVVTAAIMQKMLARNPGMRIKGIAHREELITQACNKIKAVTGLQPAIEMADQYSDESGDAIFGDRSPIVMGTIQTMSSDKRKARFYPKDFCMLWIDEAHHAPAKSYMDLIEYYSANTECCILGVTATPDRSDEVAMGKVFDTVAFDYEILDAIQDGWLVSPHQQFVAVQGLDYSHVRTTAGDLNGADLAAVMEYEETLQQVCGPTFDIVGTDRKTLVFAASVAHADRMAEIFNRRSPGCARFVHGKTPKDERRQMFRDYANGEFNILCNCAVATEGWDEPTVEVVVMARPTKSRALYAQCAGRGLRPLPGLIDHLETAEERRAAIAQSAKPSCLLLDFAGNSGTHKLMSTADILGGKFDDVVTARAAKKAADAEGGMDMIDALEEAAREIDEEAKAKRRKIVAKANYKTKTVNPFDVFEIQPPREKGYYEGRMASPKQVEMLVRNGIPDAETLTFSQASALVQTIIDRRKNDRCTFKQARALAKYGYGSDISFAQASELLNKIAANGWKPLSKATEPAAT